MLREGEAREQDARVPVTLWLSLRLGHQNWLFEFAPGDERAIVVGSFVRANVRIERRGVAPIHFHFEREGEHVQLMPGYRDELLVNGDAVHGAHLLAASSRIEFAGLTLEARCFGVESDLLLPVSSHVGSRHERRPQLTALPIPDPLSRTRVAFPAPLSDADVAFDATPMPKGLRTARLASEMRALNQQAEQRSANLRVVFGEARGIEPVPGGAQPEQPPAFVSRPVTLTIEAKKPRRNARFARLLAALRSALAWPLRRLVRRG